MRLGRLGRPLALLLLSPLLLGSGPGLTPQEERGRRIYVESTSPSGSEIIAVLGEGIEVDAAAVPCASCHGRDGKGRPEGGLTPTDVTWTHLTKPYGVTHESGRRHPPYDAKKMKRALALGLDPAGNQLHVAMPRYRMSHGDMEDLVAYLQKLGAETDPGVGEAVLRIGFLPPRPGPLESMGRAVEAALKARFAAFNAGGGLYGRRLELVVLEVAGAPAERRAGVASALARGDVLAVVGSFLAAGDEGLAAVFEEQRVPLVGPFALQVREELPLPRYVFYLLPGIEAQGAALARFARRDLKVEAPRPAVLAPRDGAFDAAVEAMGKACEGWAPLAVERYGREPFAAGELASKLAGQGADPVFFLGTGAEAAALLRAAEGLSWRPRLLVAGTAADADLFSAPASAGGRLWAALPALPDPEPQAAARHRDLAAAHALPAEHLSAQLTALAAAEVLLEALTRAGRGVGRESLVETLEGMRRFPAGYGPPVSYGAGRRMGAKGAYVLAVDLKERRFVPAAGWVDVEER